MDGGCGGKERVSVEECGSVEIRNGRNGPGNCYGCIDSTKVLTSTNTPL